MRTTDRYQVDALFQQMVGAYIDLMDSPLAKRLDGLTCQYREAKRRFDEQALEATKEE